MICEGGEIRFIELEKDINVFLANGEGVRWGDVVRNAGTYESVYLVRSFNGAVGDDVVDLNGHNVEFEERYNYGTENEPLYCSVLLSDDAKLTITGNGKVSSTDDSSELFHINSGELQLKGGSYYKFDPAPYLPSGYVSTADGDWFTVSEE